MANQPQNNNSQNDGEVGIIELLNYFKQGFKNFLNSIKNFFKKIGDLILQLLILIKDNIVYIAVVTAVFVGLYYVLNNLSGFKNYGYEMIVRPNYNSTDALYANIASYMEMSGHSEYGSFPEALQLIEISPIEDYQDKINAYYDVIDDEFSSPTKYKDQLSRDTVFFREVPIKDYEKNIEPQDYKNFKISIKSKSPLSQDDVFENIIAPVENNPSFKNLKDNFLKELDFQNESNVQSLKLIDTILYSRAFQRNIGQSENISFDKVDTKIMEEQLLVQKEKILEDLRLATIQKSENSDVISVLSDLKPAEAMRKIKRDPKHFALYGFLFAIFTLLFRRFMNYLNKYEAQEKENS